jgi:hypothetical protein
MSGESSVSVPAPAKPRWYVPTPGKFLLAILLMQGGLFLSSHYRWFWFNHDKGYTVVLALIATVLLLLLLVGDVLVSWFFRAKGQFSLAALLLLILVVAIPCGWLVREIDLARRQRDLVAAVKSRRGSVQYDLYGPIDIMHNGVETDKSPLRMWLTNTMGFDFTHDIVAVFFSRATDADLEVVSTPVRIPVLVVSQSADITDAGWLCLSKAWHIEGIELGGIPITDAGLVHLAKLKQLRSLNLSGTRVTDEGLESLRGLSQLRWLELNHTDITDQGLESLKSLTNIEELSLTGTRVTDAGLVHLKSLTQLERLSLSGTNVTEKGCEHLQALPRLRELHLNRTRIAKISGLAPLPLQTLSLALTPVTDAGLEHADGFAQLESLDLSQAKVTDAGVKHLQRLPQLKVLNLYSNRITDRAVESLRQFPRLESVSLFSTQVSQDEMLELDEFLQNRSEETRGGVEGEGVSGRRGVKARGID